MNLRFYGDTHQGMVRKNNEDSFAILTNLPKGSAAAVIADGLGGHNKGELASAVAANYAAERMQKEIHHHLSPREIGELLAEVIEKANVNVYLESLLSPQNTGMGTTLTLSYAIEDLLIISHVGDCRVYRLHQGDLELLTKDHTLGQELVNRGEITREEANTHSGRHIVTRALGVAEYITADVYIYKISKGDKLLICTDGLYGYLPDRDIHYILKQNDREDECVAELIQKANQNGGGDNVTVIVGFVK